MAKHHEPQTIATIGAKRIPPAPIEVPDPIHLAEPAVIDVVEPTPAATPISAPEPELVHDLPEVHIEEEK